MQKTSFLNHGSERNLLMDRKSICFLGEQTFQKTKMVAGTVKKTTDDETAPVFISLHRSEPLTLRMIQK